MLFLLKMPLKGHSNHVNYFIYEDIITDIKQMGTEFTDEKIKHFALQLANALEYCHDRNIIHRDVRPVK